jgi:hypothetical protein
MRRSARSQTALLEPRRLVEAPEETGMSKRTSCTRPAGNSRMLLPGKPRPGTRSPRRLGNIQRGEDGLMDRRGPRHPPSGNEPRR